MTRLFRYHPRTGWSGAFYGSLRHGPRSVSNPHGVDPVIPDLSRRRGKISITVASQLEDKRGRVIKLDTPAVLCLGASTVDGEEVWRWVAYCPPDYPLRKA